MPPPRRTRGKRERWMRWRIVGPNQGSREAAAGATFVENNQFRMKVVGKRNCKKEKNESAGERGPFAQRVAAAVGTVVQPARPPEAKGHRGDCHPQYIEKRLHR